MVPNGSSCLCVFGEFKQNSSQLDLSHTPSLHHVPDTLLLSHTLAHRNTALGSRWAQQRDSRITHGGRLCLCVWVCVRTVWRNVSPSVSLINRYSNVSLSNYRQTQCIIIEIPYKHFFHSFFPLGYFLRTRTHKGDIVSCSVPASCRATDLPIFSIPAQYVQFTTDGPVLLYMPNIG